MNPTTVIDLYPVDDDRETGRLPPTAPAGFLEQFGPARGYAVETEIVDALSLQPGLLRLYEAALQAGRTPEALGLPALAPAGGVLVCRATLRDDQGRVVATATAAQPIQGFQDLEVLETAARQRLRAALGFGGAVREAGEALDPHAQGLAVPAVSVPAAPAPAAPKPASASAPAVAVPAALSPAPEPQAPVDDAALVLLRRQLAHLAKTRGIEPPAVATKAEAHAALQALLRPVAA
mgnify:CR=1 FL=1